MHVVVDEPLAAPREVQLVRAVAERRLQRFEWSEGRIEFHVALDALDATLTFGGSSLADIVKATVLVTDPALMADVNAVYRQRFPEGFPARTSAAIKPWPLAFDIEIECVATLR